MLFPCVCKTDLSSAFTYLASLVSGSSSKDNKDYWPYVQIKSDKPRQSPVDLITSLAVTRDLPLLEIVEPDLVNHTAKFYNSGHTGE